MEEPCTILPTLNPSAPAVTSAASSAAVPDIKKRKLEDGEFRDSKYFKMRTMVRDLRPLFIEVLGASDFKNSKAAQDIQIQMKILLDLSKELRNETASCKKPEEPPLAVGSKTGNTVTHPEGEIHTPHPQSAELPFAPNSLKETVVQPPSVPNSLKETVVQPPSVPKSLKETVVQPPSVPKSLKETVLQLPSVPEILKETQSSKVEATAKATMAAGAAEENMKGLKDFSKNLEEGLSKTYVVGGSVIGWNFVLYPGGEAVYYGVTKERALSLRANK